MTDLFAIRNSKNNPLPQILEMLHDAQTIYNLISGFYTSSGTQHKENTSNC